MSYLRARVGPIHVTPPPGHYDAPVKIFLHCDTSGVDIIYTTDGEIPVANSEREHGFRSHHYQPLSGITLKGGGHHLLTVIAKKQLHIPTAPTQFKYVLSGTKIEHRSQCLRDVIIERRFNTMTTLDPPMPLRLARQRTPHLTCALIDTCPADVIKDHRKNGDDLALFALTHSSRCVSRQDTYRRIVPPSLSVAVPQLPNAVPELTPLPSLRSTTSHVLRAPYYQRPSLTYTTNPCSALTSFNNTKTSKASITTKTVKGKDGLLAKYNFRPHTSMSTASSSSLQLCWFEHHTDLAPQLENDEGDPEEFRDDSAYLDESNKILQKESSRMGMRAAKEFGTTISIKEDVAGKHKEILHLLMQAKQFCQSPIKRMLCFVAFNKIQQELFKLPAVTPADVVSVSNGTLELAEIVSSFKTLTVNAADNGQIQPKEFLLLCKYVVWVVRPIPEAVFGLVSQQWKHETQRQGVEPAVSKVELISVIEAYRRTRGCNEEALDSLMNHFYHKIKWGEDGCVQCGVILAALRVIPLIDAVMLEMNDSMHPMYSHPLEIWGELIH